MVLNYLLHHEFCSLRGMAHDTMSTQPFCHVFGAGRHDSHSLTPMTACPKIGMNQISQLGAWQKPASVLLALASVPSAQTGTPKFMFEVPVHRGFATGHTRWNAKHKSQPWEALNWVWAKNLPPGDRVPFTWLLFGVPFSDPHPTIEW